MCGASISWSQPASTDGQRLVAGAGYNLPKQYTPITHRDPPPPSLPPHAKPTPSQTNLLGVLLLAE